MALAVELAGLQKTVVDYIRSHPGVSSGQIANATGERHDSVSATLANVVRGYPSLLVREAKSNPGDTGGGHYVYRIRTSKDEVSAPLRKTARTGKPVKRKANGKVPVPDVLITLKVGERETETMTIKQARQLFEQLLAVQKFFSQD